MNMDDAIPEESLEDPKYDDHGNLVKPQEQENVDVDFLVRKEAKEGEIYLHEFIEHTKQALGYHLEQLEHMDQL